MGMFKGKAASGGGDFEQVPAGAHPGVCIGLIDLGTHLDQFKGGPFKKVRKVLLVWELDTGDDPATEPERAVVGRDFNLSMNADGSVSYGDKSNIRKLLQGWRGKEFVDGVDEIDLEAVVGKPGLVSMKEKQTGGGKDITVVDSVSMLPKGLKPFKPEHETIKYDADSKDGAPDQKWLPRIFGDEIHTVLARSLEWGGDGLRTGGATSGAAGNGQGKQSLGVGTRPSREAVTVGADDTGDIPF